jgi:hypothetical protein
MKLKEKFVLLLLCLTVAGCGSLLGGSGSRGYCDIAEPIGVSDDDLAVITDSLVEDLLIHNQVYEKLCQ